MNPVLTPTNGHVVVELTDKDRRYLKRVRLIEGAGSAEVEVTGHRMCIMQAVSALTTPGLDIPALVNEYNRLQKRLVKIEDKYHDPSWGEDWSEEDRKENDAIQDRLSELVDIMELSDDPICVSQSISSAMRVLNDRTELTLQERAKLKNLVEEILNTCPIRQVVKTYKTKPDVTIEQRDRRLPAYVAAELVRRRILGPIHSGVPSAKGASYGIRRQPIPFGEAMDLIRQAAGLYRAEVANATKS